VIPAYRALAAILLAGAAGCAHHAKAAATPPSAQVLSPENRAEAFAVGQQLAARDRANDATHRSQMDRLIDVSVVQMRDADRQTALLVQVRNKNAKRIRSLDAGLEVHAVSGGRRIGLAQLHLDRDIPGGAVRQFWVPVRYVRFGEDAGTMRLAQGRPKRAEMEVTEIRYADGSDEGYDDD
jgi:hypothetical protein